MPNTDMIEIADLNLNCNFEIGRRGNRISTTCDRHATSLVKKPTEPDISAISSRLRCRQHQGKLDGHRSGEVLATIPTSLAHGLVRAGR